jgi:hypothetical protein
MQAITKELFDKLEAAEWFSAVGQPMNDSGLVTVQTWQDAIDSCRSDVWSYVTLEAKNIYTKSLANQQMQEYRKWNSLVVAIKGVHEPLVERKVRPVMQEHSFPKAFIDCVKWDLLMAFMELEYLEHHPRSFFSGLAQIYLTGHFPCGWEGAFPGEGKLVVY